MEWIFGDAINRAGLDALGFVIKTDALCAAVWVDNINFCADRNGLIGAFGQAHIAINAVFGDDERHVG